MSELRKCPFCGGEAEVKTFVYVNYHSFVVCEKCGAKTNEYQSVRLVKSEQEAIKAWNKRTPVKEVVEKLEELKNDFVENIPDGDYLRGNVNFAVNAIEIVKEGMG